jgi:hypothetical protein
LDDVAFAVFELDLRAGFDAGFDAGLVAALGAESSTGAGSSSPPTT